MRVAPRALDRVPWYLRPFFWNQRRKYGAPLVAALVWARLPRLFVTVALLYGAIDRRRSLIPPPLRSILTVRVSQINGCHFCVDLNSATLLKRGVPEDKALEIAAWRTASSFDDRERAALDFAEAMTRSDSSVDDRHIEALRRYFDDNTIVELTALVAFQNLSSKFNAALGVPPQGFCPLPGIGGRDGAISA